MSIVTILNVVSEYHHVASDKFHFAAGTAKVGMVATPQLLFFCAISTYPSLPQYVDQEFLTSQYLLPLISP